MTPDDICLNKAAERDPDFYAAALFLRPEPRRAMFALAAFRSEVMDVIDDCHDPQLAATKLDWWRQEVGRLYGGTPQHPVSQALASALTRADLPREAFGEMIAGVEMDLRQSRYLDFKDLRRYCARSGGATALLAATILGCRAPESLAASHDLGIAIRLAEIIGDVGRHARHGRIYLPIEDLQTFGVAAAEILNARHSEDFRRLMEFQIDRNLALFDQASAGVAAADTKAARPLLAMAAISRARLGEIRRAKGEVLTQRIDLTPLRRLWIAWKSRLLG